MYEVMKDAMKTDPRYSLYKEQMDNNMSFDNVLNSVESFLGVNIEKDIISLLGDNFGMVFAGIGDVNIPLMGPQQTLGLPQQQTTPFIFPQMYAFCELKDNLKMQKAMETTVQRFIDKVNQQVKEQQRKYQEQLNLPNPQDSQENKQNQTAEKEKNKPE